jgi:DNA invertase Pin-like site-specific DNA recombinase
VVTRIDRLARSTFDLFAIVKQIVDAGGQFLHMGRPPALTQQQQEEARRRRAEGAMLKELAESYNVGRATISRLSI